MEAPRRYWEELKSELNAYPAWLPTDGIELGAFGRIVGGSFVVAGRLTDLDIPFEPTPEPAGQAFSKQRGLRTSKASKTSAQAASLDLGIDLDIHATSAYAWAFSVAGARKVAIQNMLEVNRLVAEAHKAGTWEREWQLVTAVWRVDRLTVLVARSKDVSAKVHAKGTVAEPLDVLVEETATYEYQSDDFFCVPKARDVTPLYGLHKLKGWLDPKLKGISDGAPTAELALEPADDESF